MKKCDATRAVRVVFNCSNFGSDAIFGALEVNETVLLLVSATLVTRSLATVRVTATGAWLGCEQGLLRSRLRDFCEIRNGLESTTN